MLNNVRLRFIAAALLLAGFTATAHARSTSKDMIQLQAQIQQLQDAVARLQQANDERMGVLKDLEQQTADSVGKMSLVINALQKQMQTTQDAVGTKQDQISGQIQSLNDSLDEMKARMAKMERVLGDVQGQQQSTVAMLQSMPQGAPLTAAPSAAPPVANPGNGPVPVPPAPSLPKKLPAPTASASVSQEYQQALGDYMAAKYPLASSEFTDITIAFPDDNMAGNSFYYIGEIETKSGKLSAAIKSYDHLIEHFPDNTKIPAAHLHKAEAMLSMKQTDGGVRELRTLIQRFPNAPEASLARSKLNAMGVPIKPRT